LVGSSARLAGLLGGQGGIEQLVDVFGREEELGGFGGDLVGERAEAAKLFGFEEALAECGELSDEGAAAGDGADDSFALEVLEGASDGVGVDAEVGGGAAGGRERVAGTQEAGGNGVLDLLLDLQIDRDAGACGDAERQHICTNTLVRMSDASGA